jgi:hypothetical protein
VRSAADGSINGRPAIDPMTSDEADSGGLRPVGERLIVQRHWEPAYEVPIITGTGHHGGGDTLLLNAVFRPGGADPLRQQAGYPDGLRAVAVGLAANRSMVTGQAVNIRELGIPLG